MASMGKIFGTAGEVRDLSKLAKTCMQAIEEGNQSAKLYLDQLSASTKDEAYTEAESVVTEVHRIVEESKEPLDEVCKALDAYAEFLDSLG